MSVRAVLLCLLCLLCVPAWAVEPQERLADPVLEGRARDISKGLRCLVCQNQSIDDSNADLARDLRVLVRERLTAGDTDDEVLSYVTARYGDYVLLSPPFQSNTLALWLAPALVLVAGVLAFGLWMRRRRGDTEAVLAPLTEDERQRLGRLLAEDDGP